MKFEVEINEDKIEAMVKKHGTLSNYELERLVQRAVQEKVKREVNKHLKTYMATIDVEKEVEKFIKQYDWDAYLKQEMKNRLGIKDCDHDDYEGLVPY